MMSILPVYEVIIDDTVEGLMGVSFVNRPAIKKNLLYMKDNQKLFLDEYNHIVVSPVLIPDQLIYRVDDEGNEYYIRWTIDAVYKATLKFVFSNHYNNVTIEHPTLEFDKNYEENLVSGVDVLQLWLTDGEDDIANTLYNFNVPKGTLMFKYKIYNPELWKMIVGGDVKGLSVEGIINIKKVNNTYEKSK